jgi:hypothetical protein
MGSIVTCREVIKPAEKCVQNKKPSQSRDFLSLLSSQKQSIMEEKDFSPENIGIFNVASLSMIAAKQDAIMHMLSFLIAETTKTTETADQLFKRYKGDALKQAEIISKAAK